MKCIDVITVNWNSGAQLRECLRSLERVALPDNWKLSSVYIVDNNSKDDSATGLESLTLPACLIRNSTNAGFAAACNSAAARSNADLLLFLNPDTVLFSDSLCAPVGVLERELRYAVCGIRLVDESGKTSRTCGRFPTFSTFLNELLGLNRVLPRRFPGTILREWQHENDSAVDHVIGAFYLIRRAVFEQVGGFDERFFLYLEDLDLSKRVAELGYGTFFVASRRAFHRGGGTSRQIKGRRLFYSLQSRVIYSFRHLGRMETAAIFFFTLVVESPIRLVFALLKGNFRAAKETLEAYGLFLLNVSDTLKRCLKR